MKHIILLTISLAASLSVGLYGLAAGHSNNNAIYLSILTPLVLFVLALIPLIIAIYYCQRSVFGKPSRHKLTHALIAIACVALEVILPAQVSAHDTFVKRMRNFSETEYLQLAEAFNTEFQGLGSPRMGGSPFDPNQKAIYNSLVEAHPAVASGDFNPKFFPTETGVYFYWGSGMTGTYEVAIFLAPVPEGWEARAHCNTTFIYESVALSTCSD